MAVGVEASAAGFLLVPPNGEEGRVRWGSQEINRTRDYVAQVKTLVVSGDASIRDDLTPRITQLETDLAALQAVVAAMRATLHI